MGRRVWICTVAATLGGAGMTSAAPHPLDQPDLDGTSAIALRAEAVTAPRSSYEPDPWSLIMTMAATYRITSIGAAATASLPLIWPIASNESGDHLGSLTAAAVVTRAVNPCVVLGLGAAWTVPSTSYPGAGRLAFQLARDSYRYFEHGHVGQLHADARWRHDAVTVQTQVGLEDYVMIDWRDQLLLRITTAATVWIDPVGVTVEGTLLSDAIDEAAEEGTDVVGSVSIAVHRRWRSAMVSGHVTRHESWLTDWTSTWSFGLDVSRPVSW